MISNVPIENLPKTKKVVYQHIKNEIVEDSELKKGIFTIFGPKRVGKTVLMQQLCKEFDGCYFSMRQIKNESRRERKLELHKTLISELLKCNKSLICIDDIIMIPKQYKDGFFAALREVKDRTILVSGNIKCFVDNCAEELRSLKTFTMSGLSFYEYCNWNNTSFSSLFSAFSFEFLKYKQNEEVRSPELYMQATLRDIKNCYDYPQFCEDENWIVSYRLMDEWKFGQNLQMLCNNHKSFYESMKDWGYIEPFLVQIGLISVHYEYKYLTDELKGFLTDKRHCYMNLALLGLDSTEDLKGLGEVYCCSEALRHFGALNENNRILVKFGKSYLASDFYFSNSKVVIKITRDEDEINDCVYLAKKLGINSVVVTVPQLSEVGHDTMKGVKVLKVLPDQLAYALGELETIPNVKELLSVEPLKVFNELIIVKGE